MHSRVLLYCLSSALLWAMALCLPVGEERARPASALNSMKEKATNMRPFIITKHNFMHTREKKSGLAPLPKPFVVSMELAVRDEHSGRRGRTWKAKDGSTVVEGKLFNCVVCSIFGTHPIVLYIMVQSVQF